MCPPFLCCLMGVGGERGREGKEEEGMGYLRNNVKDSTLFLINCWSSVVASGCVATVGAISTFLGFLSLLKKRKMLFSVCCISL